jgi:signal transduction histidine kinase
MGSAYPARVRLSLDLGRAIEGRLEDEIVAIVTESLSNALRHASARQVDVSVVGSDLQCEIKVSDDGLGFDTDAPTKGMGLENLRDRLERRGGELRISSSDRGTELLAVMPLS